MRARRKVEKVLDALFEEFKTAPEHELPALTGAIVDLYKSITNPLRMFLFGFGTCLILVLAYSIIRFVI